jgi:hypothetical protein
MKLSGIETATFRLVAQFLNQLRHHQRAPLSNKGNTKERFLYIIFKSKPSNKAASMF